MADETPDSAGKAKKPAMREEGNEHVYSDRVLVGNWFECRFSDHTDRRAITPCIYGSSSCTLGQSSHRLDYRPPIDAKSELEMNKFVQLRNQAFDNRLKACETNVRLYDGEAFTKNMTTTKDIFYRLKPQDAQRDIHREGHGERGQLQPHDDMLRSYGNQTRTGLNLWLCCQQQHIKCQRYDISKYQESYPPKSMVVKRVLKGGGKKWLK